MLLHYILVMLLWVELVVDLVVDVEAYIFMVV
jgi:hypothetical protein